MSLCTLRPHEAFGNVAYPAERRVTPPLAARPTRQSQRDLRALALLPLSATLRCQIAQKTRSSPFGMLSIPPTVTLYHL